MATDKNVNDNQAEEIILTTGDIKLDYVVLDLVSFRISNHGFLSSELTRIRDYYTDEIEKLRKLKDKSTSKTPSEFNIGRSQYDVAFHIATLELKKRALCLGADAVVCVRQNVEHITNTSVGFIINIYGTAVKYNYNESDDLGW
jgi:uncharacterized protein YbjQ (UPF0145 family)